MSSIYTSKSDLVTAAVRDLILQGDLVAGDPLRQRDLAERFDVSPTPVREALRRLQAEGLVAYDAHKGSTVVDVDFGPSFENLRIRACLESLAADLAARTITDDELAELEAIHEDFLRCDPDDKRIHELNRSLHFKIYECAHSGLIISLIHRLWQAFPNGPQVLRSHDESREQHGALLDALRSRDPVRAADVTFHHVMGVAAMLHGSPYETPEPPHARPSIPG